ncbi:UbiH/UbiF/VisC/COQ6 family ubiquinone biosynthesis hydroxylase [Rickettsiella endosymbiont of Dermanyssus gallinae]|uniref:UbiH/UbiF/VisC/COQ6 family ubiquinone biosynthesis hydroxylase n=1 Tax=Rickettsiella endosymbiont of Dermanyssus gallinae TaxID=2856608 RepID=UPI001C5285AA|nr:UbiH/UbiF/VisC/COQ6 family ubiquinone biosynthesis hydroxylase [Rickettsiella endosymbiont of Dermanyssus gallinae]
MTIDIPQDYDVVIVGAGLIGLTLACGLINQGLRLAIIDKDGRSKAPAVRLDSVPGYELGGRVSAITQGSQKILESYQVWQRLAKTTFSPFECMEVWEEGSASRLRFDAAETGQPCLGTILYNQALQTALLAQAKTARELDWFFPESLSAMQNEQSPILLSLASGQSITAQLLVGADGAQSCVRQLAGISYSERDYQQEALVATVRTVLAHDQTARQVFLPTGPLAFLPLADSYLSSIVWSTTPEEAKRLKALSEIDFNAELAHAFEQRLGAVEWSSARLSFALKTQHCEQYIKPGIALMGDAAHTIHPLAGQGANLGIADASCLASIILAAHQKQRALGALHTLRRYERERRFYHRVMGAGIDLIKQTFAAKNSFLVSTRHVGLSFVEKTPWLKNYFMRFAMGIPSAETAKLML